VRTNVNALMKQNGQRSCNDPADQIYIHKLITNTSYP